MKFNSVRRIFAITPALGLGLAAPATLAAEQQIFVRDGVRYIYTSETKNNATVLSGKADGRKFRLVVRGTRISGHFDQTAVTFSAADVLAERKLALR